MTTEFNPDGPWERETVINFCDAEPNVIHVWTAQRKVGRWLTKICTSLGFPIKTTTRPTWEASIPSKALLLRFPSQKKRVNSPSQTQTGIENLRLARLSRLSKPPSQ